MTNYPQDIITAYAERKIGRSQFKNLFAKWQKENGRDYTCKGTADKSGIYLTYRGVTAMIKNGILNFKTNQDDTANTPFEFRRKVDFYREERGKGILRAIATMNRYIDMAGEALRNNDENSYQINTEKSKQWADIAIERGRI
ncbi:MULTISPECIES: hypothetical protein [unclassified Treponema]|uniref:hypothetical protein n=1 Tax=unclassified Treponema TaxID=2638727 RepID=UPI0020A3A274|nr:MULTISPECIES: hypothetical protein [unclassified Treponema]UTC65983.1 hypothetical protein E4O06_08090 [Treponema sp. OMZ 789]UTC68713.1 hypothetical protein E4O01_08230 [Treponema sp. OMZ 790]UTC71443.1 hypothetical protein E4O02_08425 [Treponema sp. OMZ 791]